MKKLFVALAAGGMLFGVSETVFAVIMTYTFQGTVNSITRDTNIVDGLIAIGDSAEFTFDIDLDANGTQVRYSGQFIERTDVSNEANDVDYFWTDYVGGTDIGPIGEITAPNPNFFEETNYGLSVNRKENGVIVQDTGYLYGGSAYNWVSIENYSQNVQDWQLGYTGFQFRHIVRNQANEAAWIRGNLTLSDISFSTPVPEPTTMLLFGIGLVGIVGLRIRLKKNKV